MPEMITVVINIPRELHKKFKIYCVENNLTMRDVVAELIEKKMKK